MPTDSALLVAGQGPSPLDYRVPDAQEIITLSARAVVDGSGAASAFLPVVQLVSDAGIILAEAITDTTVAAGGSAQVSWFPGVGAAAAAATATGVEWFWAKRETNLTVNAGTNKVVPWVTSKTSDSTLFSLITGHGTANDTIQVARPGVTLTTCYCNPTAPANWKIELLLSGDSEIPLGSAGSNWLTDSNADNTPAALHNNPRDTRTSVGTASPFNLYAQVSNLDVANHTVAAFYIGVAWWPNTTLWA